MEDNLELAKKEAMESVRKMAGEVAADASKKLIEDSLVSIRKEIEDSTKKSDLETVKNEFNKSIQELKASMKEVRQTRLIATVGRVASDKALAETIKGAIIDNKDALKSYKGGNVSLETKAVTIDSFGEGEYQNVTNETLAPVYRSPYSPVYLRNIFRNVPTSQGNITIWKQAAITGAAAIWRRGTGTEGADEPKPNVSPTWEKEVVSLDWVAGTTDVQREVLDDVDFMASEVPYTLVYGPSGILAAENKMIMDYIEAHAVDFSVPSGYGDFANSLESILAAAFGQLGDSYINPTHVLINNWDYLKYIAFNKAAGSNEYDHPLLDIAVINNQLYINNLQAVPNPSVTVGEAYVIGADHSRYVSKNGVLVRLSEEHGDNFVKNMVTYRAEIRSAFFSYNDNSLVKVTLPTPEVPAE